MRAIWSGSLGFGLVNIPVRIYSAADTESKIKFDMLHGKDMGRIRYAKVCQLEGEEVPNEEIVKGFEYEDGEYVIMTDEDFKKADVGLAKSIEIMDFTDESQIDEMYFEKPYYLEPDKGAGKAYGLLRDALKKIGKVGIARFVLRNREHLAAIRPYDSVLVLNQLRYSSEIRKPEGLDLPESGETDERELELALALVDKLSGDFKPEKYHDTYTEELRDIIRQKAEGRVPVAKGGEPEPTAVIDLMEVLKKSLEQENKSAA
jgi:DNA end-binding protein Ku